MKSADAQIQETLARLRLVLVLLAGGTLALAVIMYSLGRGNPPQPEHPLIWALGAMIASSVGAFPVIRSQLITIHAARLSGIEGDALLVQALKPYQALTMIGAAMAEGCGIFAAVTMLVTGEQRVLVVVPIALVVIALLNPTRARLESFAQTLSHAAVR